MKSFFALVLLPVLYHDSWTQATPLTTPAGNGNNLWMDDVVAGLMGLISRRNESTFQSDQIASPKTKTALDLREIETTTAKATTYVTSSLELNYSTGPVRKSTAEAGATTSTTPGKVKDGVINTTNSALNNLNINRILKNIFGKLADPHTTTEPVTPTTDGTRRQAQEPPVDWKSKTLDMLNNLGLGLLPQGSNQSSANRLPPSPDKAEPLVDGSSSLNTGVSSIITQGNNDLLPENNGKELPVYKTGQLATPNDDRTGLDRGKLFTTSAKTLASPSSTTSVQSTGKLDTTTVATLSPFLLNIIAQGLLQNPDSVTPSKETSLPSSTAEGNSRNKAIDALGQTSEPEIITEPTTPGFSGNTDPVLPTSSTRETVVYKVKSTTSAPKTSMTRGQTSSTKFSQLPTTRTTTKSSLRTSTSSRRPSITTKAFRAASTQASRMGASTTKLFRVNTTPTRLIYSTTKTSPKAMQTTPRKTPTTTTTAVPPKTQTSPSTTSSVKLNRSTTKKQRVNPLNTGGKQSESARVTPPSVFATTSEQTTAVEDTRFTRPTFLSPARLPKLQRPVPNNLQKQFRQEIIDTEATSQQMPVTQSSISNGTGRCTCYWTNRAYLIAVVTTILVIVLHT